MRIPPLRERAGDIPLLLDHFLEEAARELSKKKPTPPPELTVLLSTYSFPGNVRELKAMVYDAVSAHQGRILSMEAFRRAIGRTNREAEQSRDKSALFASAQELPTLSEAVELLIDAAMERAEGNQSIASRLLGISQPALSKRLKQSPVGSRQPSLCTPALFGNSALYKPL